MNKKNIVIGVLVALTLLFGFLAAKNSTSLLGGSGLSHFQKESFLQGLTAGSRDQFSISNLGQVTVGATGTLTTQQNRGICYIKAYATTIAASSTATVDCQATAAVSASGISALAGVRAGDVTNATLSTSTAGTTFLGLQLSGASASSTSGYIVLRVSNLTGTTFTWPTTGAATGTASYSTGR